MRKRTFDVSVSEFDSEDSVSDLSNAESSGRESGLLRAVSFE